MWAGAVALFRDLLVNYGAAQLSALGAAFVGAVWLAFVLFKREPFRSFRLRKRSPVEALFVLGIVFLAGGAASVGIWFSVGKWGPVPAKPLDAKGVAEEVAKLLPKTGSQPLSGVSAIGSSVRLVAPTALYDFRWVPLDHLQALMVVGDTASSEQLHFGLKNLGNGPAQDVRVEWSFAGGSTAEIVRDSQIIQRFRPTVDGSRFALHRESGDSLGIYFADREAVTVPYLISSAATDHVDRTDMPTGIHHAFLARMIAGHPRPGPATSVSDTMQASQGPAIQVVISYRLGLEAATEKYLVRSSVTARATNTQTFGGRDSERVKFLSINKEHRAPENLLAHIRFSVERVPLAQAPPASVGLASPIGRPPQQDNVEPVTHTTRPAPSPIGTDIHGDARRALADLIAEGEALSRDMSVGSGSPLLPASLLGLMGWRGRVQYRLMNVAPHEESFFNDCQTAISPLEQCLRQVANLRTIRDRYRADIPPAQGSPFDVTAETDSPGPPLVKPQFLPTHPTSIFGPVAWECKRCPAVVVVERRQLRRATDSGIRVITCPDCGYTERRDDL